MVALNTEKKAKGICYLLWSHEPMSQLTALLLCHLPNNGLSVPDAAQEIKK